MTNRSLWYVVNVFAGFEKKVAQIIREEAQKKNLTDYFEEILIPTEEVVELRRGAKVKTEKNYFPGYILVKMALTDESWHLVRNIPRVGGFLGSKGKPMPISKNQVEKILAQVQASTDKPRHTVLYEIGEQIRVIDGPFSSFSGIVEDIDQEKSRMKVSVMIFGRPTPVELEFGQVEKG